MSSVPIYVEAAPGERPDAYFRKGVVSTPLRLEREAAGAQLDPRAASVIAAVSRVSAALPGAAALATIARCAETAEAVGRAGFAPAPIDAALAPDAAIERPDQ